MLTKLKQLTNIPAVSGNETEAVLWLKKKLKSHADELYIDNVGNLIAIKGQPKTAIFSHIDKIGFMVSEVTPNKIAVVPTKYKSRYKQMGKGPMFPILVGADKLMATLVSKAGEMKDLCLIMDPDDAKKVNIGDFVSLAPNFQALGNSLICGQGLDNSLGVIAGMEIFKSVTNIAFVATVQEEITHLGAKVVTEALKPKKVIILDVEYDECPVDHSTVFVGKGPSICLKDSIFPAKKLTNSLISIAKKYQIPHQLGVFESGGSDANAIFNLNGGTPFVFIGIPLKFMHTAHELGSLTDLKNTIKLLTTAWKEIST